MKTAIAYYSKHHGNTEKLLKAIAERYEVTLIDVTEKTEVNLSEYDRIGFASGIYYGGFAKQVQSFASANLPEGRETFFIATCGNPMKGYFNAIKKITEEKGCKNLGEYMCLGFDTFGPFKLVGGLAKGHPDEAEIEKAVEFYSSLDGKKD
ncbi:MAG: flavodoxin family protein [Lachnospiraceae bacterium]|nr:flavodoxin family protein [Lachnospiraceae bacterium]